MASTAQGVARRLSVRRRRRRDAGTERCTGALASVPDAYRCEGIDLDAAIA